MAGGAGPEEMWVGQDQTVLDLALELSEAGLGRGGAWLGQGVAGPWLCFDGGLDAARLGKDRQGAW